MIDSQNNLSIAKGFKIKNMASTNHSRDVMVREYLRQQSQMVNQEDFTESLTRDGQINVHHRSVVPHQEVDQDETEQLNDFKEQVKVWLKLDNEISAINSKIKLLDNERKHRRKLLKEYSTKILKFMGNNEIDELNSKDGIIKYQKRFVKETLTHTTIKNKLMDQFSNTPDAAEKINRVFVDRNKVEKLSLKRS